MAHFGSYDLVPPQPTTVPTLEGAYKKLMSKLTNIEGFVRQHMTVRHLLEDPWEEAGDLQ